MTPSPYDHVVFTDLDGTEGVLVDLQSKQYFQLNETACVVWRGLAKKMPIADIAKEMTTLYDVTLAHAQASVEAAIRELVAHHLVRPA
jgi:Coenzyme PQQ synthesis protein D (PqqD)